MQDAEPAKAFGAFCVYRDLGVNRSLTKVVQNRAYPRATDRSWATGRPNGDGLNEPRPETLTVVPLLPELRVILSEALEQAPDGAEYVISRYRRHLTVVGDFAF